MEEIPEIEVSGEEILAEGADLRWGAMEFHPYLGADWHYTDNLFYSKNNRVDDNAFTFTPGVHINYPFAGNHVAKFDWQSQIRRYMDNVDASFEQHFSDALIKLDYDRFFLEWRNKWAYLEEVGDLEFTDRLARWAIDASFRSGIRFEPLDFSFGYQKKLRAWPKDQFHDLDHSLDVAHAQVDIPAGISLKFFTRYEFRHIDFDGDLTRGQFRRNDQKQQQMLAGASGSWGPTIGWSLAAGAEHIQLHNRARTRRNEWGHASTWHPVVRGNIKWDVVPERTHVTAGFDRNVRQSLTSDYADTWLLNASVRHRWSERLKTKAELTYTLWNRAKNVDFGSWSARVSTQYRITRWASVYARWEYNDRDTYDDNRSGDYKINTGRLGFVLAW